MPENPQVRAKNIVRNYIKLRTEPGTEPAPVFEVKVVWFCKTLQNWKALVITTLPDEMYYELTYNGDKDDVYLDVYKKVENLLIGKGGYRV